MLGGTAPNRERVPVLDTHSILLSDASLLRSLRWPSDKVAGGNLSDRPVFASLVGCGCPPSPIRIQNRIASNWLEPARVKWRPAREPFFWGFRPFLLLAKGLGYRRVVHIRAAGGADRSMVFARQPWRLHDIRRTVATGMQALAIRIEIIERF